MFEISISLMRTWLVVISIFLQFVVGYTPLSDSTLLNLPAAGSDFDIKTGEILAPILIPRVPGTPGSTAVKEHFAQWFSTHLPKWTVEYQNSTSKTPATGDKQVPFVNFIITRDPPWARPGDVGRLALVAHYDSKLSPAGFIGATDSAAPCAMIMHAARSVDEALTRKWAAMEAEGSHGLEEEKGVQLLLLDGEEAFVVWNNEDSVYGARSLAETWESTPHAAMSTYHNKLSSISLFLLLDLLGAPNPHVPSFFKTTHWAYQHLAEVESRMRTLSLLESQVEHPFLPQHNKDPNSFMSSGIEDDHIPFMTRGVEVLHIIPSPFPDVWHLPEDDPEHLDMPTVQDWAKIVTAFVGEWMDLEGYFPTKEEAEARIRKTRSNPLSKDELQLPPPHDGLAYSAVVSVVGCGFMKRAQLDVEAWSTEELGSGNSKPYSASSGGRKVTERSTCQSPGSPESIRTGNGDNESRGKAGLSQLLQRLRPSGRIRNEEKYGGFAWIEQKQSLNPATSVPIGRDSFVPTAPGPKSEHACRHQKPAQEVGYQQLEARHTEIQRKTEETLLGRTDKGSVEMESNVSDKIDENQRWQGKTSPGRTGRGVQKREEMGMVDARGDALVGRAAGVKQRVRWK
ncbi:uncharacterized protein BP5553_10647 [Venustampulla echinocandica]|uniref:Peptide hydrolase n=1 Tax=Venustampulla echinocandica TaxID=2656787 RepID=A0A370T8P0_9HELO|nr:uncharacterized protein BP5553_10647 [Venustampulla echinocandica]RDL29782.1 hypothetical protein BP5553_10647 [Venustampulla echinocandica]